MMPQKLRSDGTELVQNNSSAGASGRGSMKSYGQGAMVGFKASVARMATVRANREEEEGDLAEVFRMRRLRMGGSRVALDEIRDSIMACATGVPGQRLRGSMGMSGDWSTPAEHIASQVSSARAEPGSPTATNSTMAHPSWWSAHAAALLRSQTFDFITGFVIIANSITIGIEQSLIMAKKDTSFIGALEHLFLLVYIFDLSLWFVSSGFACLKNNWVKIDCFFVGLGIATTWILQPIADARGIDPGDATGELRLLMVLRMLRLLRLARAVRLLYKFKQLWILVQGLMASMGTMAYVLLLVSVILYMFGCVAIEVITNSGIAEVDAEAKRIVETNFRSLPVTMLTLIQFTAMDSVAAIYVPLIERRPALAIYFIFLVLVVAVVLMNLVTAVIVEAALEETSQLQKDNQDEERQRRARLIGQLLNVCEALDKDDSGFVSRDEIQEASMSPPNSVEYAAFQELCRLLQAVDLDDIYVKLDMHTGDNVEIGALCDGMYKMIMFEIPVQLLRVERDCAKMRQKMDDIDAKLDLIYDLLLRERQQVSTGGPAGGAEEAPPTPGERRRSRPAGDRPEIGRTVTFAELGPVLEDGLADDLADDPPAVEEGRSVTFGSIAHLSASGTELVASFSSAAASEGAEPEVMKPDSVMPEVSEADTVEAEVTDRPPVKARKSSVSSTRGRGLRGSIFSMTAEANDDDSGETPSQEVAAPPAEAPEEPFVLAIELDGGSSGQAAMACKVSLVSTLCTASADTTLSQMTEMVTSAGTSEAPDVVAAATEALAAPPARRPKRARASKLRRAQKETQAERIDLDS